MSVQPPCVPVLFLAAALSLPAALDALYREVDPELWAGLLPAGAGVGVYYLAWLHSRGAPVLAYVVMSLVFALILLVLYLAGLLGGADVFAGLLVALAMPAPPRPGLPPVVVVLLYASILGIVHRALVLLAREGPGAALRGGTRVRVERLLRDPRYKWWLPRGVHVEENWSESLAALPSGERVKAGPGTPMVTYILVALFIYLILGDPLWLVLPPEWPTH